MTEQEKAIEYIEWLKPKLIRIYEDASNEISPLPGEGYRRAWLQSNAEDDIANEAVKDVAVEVLHLLSSIKEEEPASAEAVRQAVIDELLDNFLQLNVVNKSTNTLKNVIQLYRVNALQFMLRKFRGTGVLKDGGLTVKEFQKLLELSGETLSWWS